MTGRSIPRPSAGTGPASSPPPTTRLRGSGTRRPGAKSGAPMRHDGPVRSAAFDRDGTRVVTASLDNYARRLGRGDGARNRRAHAACRAGLFGGLRVETGRASSPPPATTHGAGVGRGDGARKSASPCGMTGKRSGRAAFSGDGTRVVTASEGQTARVWDAATGPRRSAALKGHDGPVWSAAFSGDWDAGHHRLLRRDGAGLGRGDGAPNRRAHARGMSGGSLPRLSIETGRASSPPRATRRRGSGTRRRGAKSAHPMRHDETVWSAAFSGDGTRVVAASEDKTARVWDCGDGAREIGAPGRDGGLRFRGLQRRPDARGVRRLRRPDGADLGRGDGARNRRANAP